jgi:4-aminobutyrate aminotransferase-like enzyme
MGGTYSGNAVSCAAGVAVIETLEKEKVLENAQARSKEFFSALRKLKDDPKTKDIILDVRGLGLMIGIEFNSPAHHAGLPARAGQSDNLQSNKKQMDKVASRVTAKCLEKGMIVLTTSGKHPSVGLKFVLISCQSTRSCVSSRLSTSQRKKRPKRFAFFQSPSWKWRKRARGSSLR